MRAAAVLVLAAAAAGQDSPTCFAKPADASANLLWATQQNKTMCLVPCSATPGASGTRTAASA